MLLWLIVHGNHISAADGDQVGLLGRLVLGPDGSAGKQPVEPGRDPPVEVTPGVLLRLLRGPYERGERRAFRYA